jgi:hypothetical protein
MRMELVRPDQASFAGDEAYRFRHLLIRDAAYQALAKQTRSELHERFAAWLERVAADRLAEYEEIVAYHLEQAYRYRAELDHLISTPTARCPGRDSVRRPTAPTAEGCGSRPELLERAMDSATERRATTPGRAARVRVPRRRDAMKVTCWWMPESRAAGDDLPRPGRSWPECRPRINTAPRSKTRFVMPSLRGEPSAGRPVRHRTGGCRQRPSPCSASGGQRMSGAPGDSRPQDPAVTARRGSQDRGRRLGVGAAAGGGGHSMISDQRETLGLSGMGLGLGCKDDAGSLRRGVRGGCHG